MGVINVPRTDYYQFKRGKRLFIGGMCAERFPCEHSVYTYTSFCGVPYSAMHTSMDGQDVWKEISKNSTLYSASEIQHFKPYEDWEN